MAKVLKVGDPYEPGVVVGPVITEQHRDRVESYIQAGRDEAARFSPAASAPRSPTPATTSRPR